MISYKEISQVTTKNHVWLVVVRIWAYIVNSLIPVIGLVAMAFVAFCFLVHDGRVKVFLDDERLELSEWHPSCLCCTVFLHFSIDQGQPNPKDNFLVCRSKPVYTSSLGQPTECQLMGTFYSGCGAIFLVLLVFFSLTLRKQSVVMFGCKTDKPNHKQVFMLRCHSYFSHNLGFGIIHATLQGFITLKTL